MRMNFTSSVKATRQGILTCFYSMWQWAHRDLTSRINPFENDEHIAMGNRYIPCNISTLNAVFKALLEVQCLVMSSAWVLATSPRRAFPNIRSLPPKKTPDSCHAEKLLSVQVMLHTVPPIYSYVWGPVTISDGSGFHHNPYANQTAWEAL